MIFDPMAEPTPTYRLDGEALQVAKEIHEYSLKCNVEYLEIQKQVQEFHDALMGEFDEKHNEPFQKFFEHLAKSLAMSIDEIRTFRLDATYLDDHNLAFMKQGPIEDRVLVMNSDDLTEEELGEVREEGEL